jgi:hypothetical protein
VLTREEKNPAQEAKEQSTDGKKIREQDVSRRRCREVKKD